MSATLEPLLTDLLHWLARSERPYHEVMEAWRTSCPRLPVWEEANDRAFISYKRVGAETLIGLTPVARRFLTEQDR